jgi:hypothetical protein
VAEATTGGTADSRRQFGASAKTESCLICFENAVNTVVLCCMNSFHVHCLAQWLEKGNANCPSCRAAIHWQLERKKIIIPQVTVPNVFSFSFFYYFVTLNVFLLFILFYFYFISPFRCRG